MVKPHLDQILNAKYDEEKRRGTLGPFPLHIVSMILFLNFRLLQKTWTGVPTTSLISISTA